jgi:lysophospholipase L1-like esterase
VPVQVLSAGRTANAGSFTFTFSVLVFGDSITWGTFNIYVPDTGQKIATQVNGPYPLVLKNLLSANPRFGSYTRVTNAGIPGEQATGQGEQRMPRCLSTGPLGTCANSIGVVPGDFTRPFDVVILLEGINDLIGGRTPERARDALRTMILSAKSSGVRVILGRFDSFKTNQETGYWTGLAESVQLANLTEALAVEQGLPRIRFDGISMSWDGLHPDQLGYDKMGTLAVEKVFSSFPP